MRLWPPGSTLFPYTTLFRSRIGCAAFYPGFKAQDQLFVRLPVDREVADHRQVAQWLDRHVRLGGRPAGEHLDRKSTRLNSSHGYISYAVFCLKKKKKSIFVF